MEAEVRSRLSEAGECDTEIEVISRELVLFARRSGDGWEAVLDDAVRRRIEDREPLQYIIGEWDFHELRGLAYVNHVCAPDPRPRNSYRVWSRLWTRPPRVETTRFECWMWDRVLALLGLALLHQWQDAELVAY